MRAKELRLVLPDPSLMVKTLEKAVTLMTDPQVNLKLNLQKIELELEINPTYASVDAFAKDIKAELQTMSYATAVQATTDATPTTTTKVKALQQKGAKGEGKSEENKTSTWKEPCRYFGSEKGCMHGRNCNNYHRRATGDECIICGSTTHKSTEFTRPKEETVKGKWKGE